MFPVRGKARTRYLKICQKSLCVVLVLPAWGCRKSGEFFSMHVDANQSVILKTYVSMKSSLQFKVKSEESAATNTLTWRPVWGENNSAPAVKIVSWKEARHNIDKYTSSDNLPSRITAEPHCRKFPSDFGVLVDQITRSDTSSNSYCDMPHAEMLLRKKTCTVNSSQTTRRKTNRIWNDFGIVSDLIGCSKHRITLLFARKDGEAFHYFFQRLAWLPLFAPQCKNKRRLWLARCVLKLGSTRSWLAVACSKIVLKLLRRKRSTTSVNTQAELHFAFTHNNRNTLPKISIRCGFFVDKITRSNSVPIRRRTFILRHATCRYAAATEETCTVNSSNSSNLERLWNCERSDWLF